MKKLVEKMESEHNAKVEVLEESLQAVNDEKDEQNGEIIKLKSELEGLKLKALGDYDQDESKLGSDKNSVNSNESA